jgi:polar amino acid transport system substrate-binding protein
MLVFTKRWLPALIAVLMVAAVPRAAQIPNLAPSGTLRAAFLATNPVHARTDPQTGEITGPVPDLVKELARRLQTPFVLIPAANAAAVIGHMQKGTADIGFLAYDQERARDVDFAGAFMTMFNTYAVAAASPLRVVADADRAGVQIGAVKGQTPQIHLSGSLRNARMRVFEATPDQAGLEKLLVGGDVDAFALNQQRAEEAAAASQGRLRALRGSFFDAEQSVVVKKGESEKAAFLAAFVEELKASGFIKTSLDRAKLVGVGVAPPIRR